MGGDAGRAGGGQDRLFRIEHETIFHYGRPVHDVGLEVRVHPLDETGQVCEWFDLQVEPKVQVFSYQDFYGNQVHNFSVPEPVQRVRILAQATVRRWQPVATQPAPLAPMDVYEMCRSSSYVQVDDAGIQALASALAGDGSRPETGWVEAIMDEIHGRFAYLPGSTDVNSTVSAVLARASGVCQDFAHVMIAICRAAGLPARYVSGYLYGGSGDTGGDVVGTGATHAWVEVYLAGRGWLGYDPTNDTLAGLSYIKTAVGRDYGDVPPTKGVYKGKAEERLEVNVRVEAR